MGMEQLDRIDTLQTRVARPRNRILISTLLAIASLAIGTAAQARPDPIEPPVEMPEDEDSPGTGQEAPDDPDEPPPIEPPEGLDCIDDEDQSDCDPDHPGGEQGQRPSNTPPRAWYNDMSYRMYELQESLDDMAYWSAGRDPYINYFSRWMKSVTQQYYALGFYPQGTPRQYSYGKMTRGDFNYYAYYWVRPIYFSLLYYSTQYYEDHRGDPQIPYYRDMLSKVSSSYHPLILCNYGFNGNDQGSREDLRARRAERRAGLGD